MVLAHDYARLASLICKQNFLHVHSLCGGILFNSTALRIRLRKTLQHYNFKTRLDGEMCSSDVFPKANVLSPAHTYQDIFENGEFILSGMSSSNTCDFSLHSHSTSNCKCSSSSPYYSHLTQTRPIISFYFSKTVPVLQFLIFATVLPDFAKRLFYSNSTCTSCSLLLKSCCSFWMVAFFSV